MCRFACSDPVPDAPCITNPDCSCVEYNFRDGHWVAVGGNFGMPVGNIMLTGSAVADPNSQFWTNDDNTVGMPYLQLTFSATDVMGNDWDIQDWIQADDGYAITLWD